MFTLYLSLRTDRLRLTFYSKTFTTDLYIGDDGSIYKGAHREKKGTIHMKALNTI